MTSKVAQILFSSDDLIPFMKLKIKHGDRFRDSIIEIKECMDAYLKGGHCWNGKSDVTMINGHPSKAGRSNQTEKCFIEVVMVIKWCAVNCCNCAMGIDKNIVKYINVVYQNKNIMFKKTLIATLCEIRKDKNDQIKYLGVKSEFSIKTVDEYVNSEYPNSTESNKFVAYDIVDFWEN